MNTNSNPPVLQSIDIKGCTLMYSPLAPWSHRSYHPVVGLTTPLFEFKSAQTSELILASTDVDLTNICLDKGFAPTEGEPGHSMRNQVRYHYYIT